MKSRLRYALERLLEQTQASIHAIDNGHATSTGALLSLIADVVTAEAQDMADKRIAAAHALARGVVGQTIYGEDVRFEVNDGVVARTAQVYPNAHNKGATYGIRINAWEGGKERYVGGSCRGTDWARRDAEKAARDWVRDGIMPGE